MAFDPAPINQRIASDPEYQQIIRDMQIQPQTREQLAARESAYSRLQNYVKQLGLPPGYAANLKEGGRGEIVEKEGDFPGWSKYAMAGISGLAAAGPIIDAISGIGAGVGGATAASSAPAAAGTGAATTGAGAGMFGIPGLTTGNILKAAPSILGGMANRSQQSNQNRDFLQQQRDRNALERYQIGIKAPGLRLGQSRRAAILKNYTPTSVKWGGPGSGLRGETVHFSNALTNPNLFKGDVSAQAQDLIHQNMLNQLKHGADLPALSEPGRESLGQKILGGAAMGTSILGGINRARTGQPPPEEDNPYKYDWQAIGKTPVEEEAYG